MLTLITKITQGELVLSVPLQRIGAAFMPGQSGHYFSLAPALKGEADSTKSDGCFVRPTYCRVYVI